MSDTLKPGQALIFVAPDQEEASLVKCTPTGLVRAVRTYVRMRPDKGETYSMSVKDPKTKKWVEKRILTAGGYYRLNQFAGVSFSTPENLVNDVGEKTGNPYFHRENGEVQYVKVRRIGVGRNAVGNWIAMDLTVTYNLSLYFAQDLWSKWRGKWDAAETAGWGDVYSSDNIPQEIATDSTKKAIKCPGGVSLVVNLKSMPVLSIFQEHINRQKFCERNAITICERNILKKILGEQYVGEDLRVPIVSWQQADLDKEIIADMMARSRDGKINIGGEVIDVESEHVDVSDKEEVDAALHGDVDEEAIRDQEMMGSPVDVDSDESQTDADRDSALAFLREVWGCLSQDDKDNAAEKLVAEGYPTVSQAIQRDTSAEELREIAGYLRHSLKKADLKRLFNE